MAFVVVLVVLVTAGATAALLIVRSRRPALDEAPTPTAAEPASDGEIAAADVTRVDDAGVDEKDEAAAARFRLPGERSTVGAFGPPVLVPLVTVRHLETPATEPPDLEAPATVTPDARPIAVEDVVSALVERVRTSDDDVMSVVSEMVEQDLDIEQMEEVLTEIVERDRSAQAKREELTLSGPDVPQRPGRLSAFADMPEHQKRRVIIRVLCLLIARSEEYEPASDDRPEYTVTLPDTSLEAKAEPTARDLWGEPEADARDVHLPARRRGLVRAPR